MLKFQKMTKNSFFFTQFGLKWPKKRQKIEKCFFCDFSMFLTLLTRSLRNGFQKFNVFFTETSIYFGCRNSGFIEAMDLIFFLNDSKLYVDAKNGKSHAEDQ